MSATKDKLIQVAFELFGRNGFHGVGLDRIIDETGVSKQTFYNHFESKDDLVLAVLEHRHAVEFATMKEMLQKLAGEDPKKKLYAIFDALDRWYNEPEWRGCIFITAAAEFPLRTEPAHRAAESHMLAIQEHLQYLATLAQACDPKTLAEELSILIEGAVSYRHVTGNARTTEIVKRVAHHLLDEQLNDKPFTSALPDSQPSLAIRTDR